MPGSPRFRSQPAFDEVWFLEAVDAAGAHVWARMTLRAGLDPCVETWFLFSRPGQPLVTAYERSPLEGVQLGQEPFIQTAHAHIGSHTADGTLQAVSWSLTLSGGRPPYRMVPARLERMGLGRTYAPVAPDVRVQGTITALGQVHAFDGRGTLGHIHGVRSRVHQWVWCHAALPGGAVLEILSARLQVGPLQVPMTSAHLSHPDGDLSFCRMQDLLRTRTRVRPDGWDITARRGDVSLRAHVAFHPDHPGQVLKYTAPDGASSWCRNTAHLHVRVSVQRHDRSRFDGRTDQGIGEIGSREPHGRVCLPPEAS